MDNNIEINVDNNKVKENEVVVSKSRKSSNNNKKKNNNTAVVLIVSIFLSFVCGGIGAYLIVSNYTVESVVKNITTSELVETSISTSVDKVYGSTVIIVAYKDGKQVSTGTGFVYKKDNNKAFIMTNNHVIDKADEVEVEFNDKKERIDAEILGGEVYSDIAVLTIDVKEAENIVEIGDSESIRLGDTIFTVGSPMGISYKGTVTKGILSGKDRMVEVNLSGNTSDYYMKVLQLDAAVNPGNSGGPLCDVSGKVIGIISLKIVQDEVEGMGFAIPIEDALEYANAIEELDVEIPLLLNKLNNDDLLIITADHGNDPTYRGTDHTRENVPVIVYSRLFKEPKRLPVLTTFADIGATIADNFDTNKPEIGNSFLNMLKYLLADEVIL